LKDIAIHIKDISKKFDEVIALNQISIEIKRGELFGLIGPDGAGKTTLFKILTTLLKPESGQAFLENLDVTKEISNVRESIGYMPGKFSLYQDLTIFENLSFFATAFGTTIEENYHLIKDIYTQIEPFKNRKAGALSGGMKQKLALCCALIHKPKVLLLDEPTTGVDAVSRKEFWEMLKRLKEQGITILVSTPYMDEAGMCDRVALMQSGSILTIDTPEKIVTSFKHTLWGVRANQMYRLLNDLKAMPEVSHAYPSGIYHHVILKNGTEKQALQQYLEGKGHAELELIQSVPTIEDCFMNLMEHTNA